MSPAFRESTPPAEGAAFAELQEAKVAEPLQSIDKLTVVDTGNGQGAARLSNYVTSLMATAPEMLKNISGVDLEKMVKRLTKEPEEA